MSRHCLTRDEKAKIIMFYGKYNNKWRFISGLLDLPESTMRNFIKRYKKNRSYVIFSLMNFLKKRKTTKFSDSNQLFQRLFQEWDAITPGQIHNFYESFRAR